MKTNLEAIGTDLVQDHEALNQAYEVEKDRREQVLSVIKRINSSVTNRMWKVGKKELPTMTPKFIA